jgi:hypothetical protein
MNAPLELVKKLYWRPSAWPDQDYHDIMIACHNKNVGNFEASIELHDFNHDGEISPQLCIFAESFIILPLLVAALLTLPDPTTEDDIAKALEAVGFTNAVDEPK